MRGKNKSSPVTSLDQNGITVTNKQEISEIFNNYFCDIPRLLAHAVEPPVTSFES